MAEEPHLNQSYQPSAKSTIGSVELVALFQTLTYELVELQFNSVRHDRSTMFESA